MITGIGGGREFVAVVLVVVVGLLYEDEEEGAACVGLGSFRNTGTRIPELE